MNMPTKPSEITGAYTSHLQYSGVGCDQLIPELASLARRENQLVSAQEQRYKTSETQAFWYGYGQGDGVVASELATVRGEKEAVRKAIDQLQGGCYNASVTPSTSNVAQPTTNTSSTTQTKSVSPSSTSEDPQLELALWGAVKDSNNITLLLHYIQQYPSGIFVAVARAKISALNGNSTYSGIEPENEIVGEWEGRITLQRNPVGGTSVQGGVIQLKLITSDSPGHFVGKVIEISGGTEACDGATVKVEPTGGEYENSSYAFSLDKGFACRATGTLKLRGKQLSGVLIFDGTTGKTKIKLSRVTDIFAN
jgi:hypothetical protein